MRNGYQARWVSKDRVHSLKKTGQSSKGILLDSLKGFIVVEPPGADLGDGDVLSRDVADTELQPVWCRDPSTRVMQARQLLHLDAAFPTPEASVSR
jgi:hypothetical protein